MSAVAPITSRARAVLSGFAPFAVALVLLAALQPLLPPTATIVLINVGVNVVLAVSLNVVNGFTGQFSLGHAGFMAVGAYTSAKITLAFAVLILVLLLRPQGLLGRSTVEKV